jgi:hypothetical protein
VQKVRLLSPVDAPQLTAPNPDYKVGVGRELMSALGQEQTYAVQPAMSALHPKATVKADVRNGSCLLYPRKRTCAARSSMSAKGHNRT